MLHHDVVIGNIAFGIGIGFHHFLHGSSRHTARENVSQFCIRPFVTSPVDTERIFLLQAVMGEIEHCEERNLIGKEVVREVGERTVRRNHPISNAGFGTREGGGAEQLYVGHVRILSNRLDDMRQLQVERMFLFGRLAFVGLDKGGHLFGRAIGFRPEGSHLSGSTRVV